LTPITTYQACSLGFRSSTATHPKEGGRLLRNTTISIGTPDPQPCRGCPLYFLVRASSTVCSCNRVSYRPGGCMHYHVMVSSVNQVRGGCQATPKVPAQSLASCRPLQMAEGEIACARCLSQPSWPEGDRLVVWIRRHCVTLVRILHGLASSAS
jgi:hypothetical protein